MTVLREQTLATIAKIISEQADRPITLSEETDVRALFNGSMGFPTNLDSLDLVEIVMTLEDHFNIIIEDEEAEAARTGADWVDMVLTRKP